MAIDGGQDDVVRVRGRLVGQSFPCFVRVAGSEIIVQFLQLAIKLSILSVI